MRKSKLLTVLVAAAIGVSMVGCGSSGGSSSSGSGASSSGGDVANKDLMLIRVRNFRDRWLLITLKNTLIKLIETETE